MLPLSDEEVSQQHTVIGIFDASRPRRLYIFNPRTTQAIPRYDIQLRFFSIVFAFVARCFFFPSLVCAFINELPESYEIFQIYGSQQLSSDCHERATLFARLFRQFGMSLIRACVLHPVCRAHLTRSIQPSEEKTESRAKRRRVTVTTRQAEQSTPDQQTPSASFASFSASLSSLSSSGSDSSRLSSDVLSHPPVRLLSFP